RRTLNDPLGFLAREPFLALQVFAEPSRAHREIAREDGDAILENVHVGHFVTDVDETDDALHGVGMVQLEGVVNGERVDVDDGGIESGLADLSCGDLFHLYAAPPVRLYHVFNNARANPKPALVFFAKKKPKKDHVPLEAEEQEAAREKNNRPPPLPTRPPPRLPSRHPA